MAVITSTAFRNALQGMSVTNVERHYDYPPGTLNAADLPALWIMPPGATLSGRATSCINDSKSRNRDVIIALEAVALDKTEQNYDLIDPMIDNLESALDTLLNTTDYFYEYNMTSGEVNVAGHAYWAVICTVSIRSTL